VGAASPSPSASGSKELLVEKKSAVILAAKDVQHANQSAKQAKAAAAKQAVKDKMLAYQSTSGRDIASFIRAGDVRFLSCEWLLSRPEYWKISRCQDLPKEAFLPPEEALWLYERLGGLVIVSYPWLTKGHPDPQGFHFHTLQLYLRVHQKHFLSSLKPAFECFRDVGVFWDYGSLPQGAGRAERTPHDQNIFAKGMKTVEYLYGGPMTVSVYLKQMPHIVSIENMNRTPYESRGWCFFEEVTSSVKSSFQQLNLSLVSDQLEEKREWQLLASAAQAEKRPPMHPEQFRQELIQKTFSSKEDFEILLNKYTEFFYHLAAPTLEISLPQQSHIAGSRPWGAREVDCLVKALPAFSSCMKLNLRGRALGDIGAEKLAKALSSMMCLEILWLNNCDIGNKGIGALAPVFSQLKKLIDLKLHGSRFTANGLRELTDITFFPLVECKETSGNETLPAGDRKFERKDLQLDKLEDLTLPVELSRTPAAEVLEKLVKQNATHSIRLMVKWI